MAKRIANNLHGVAKAGQPVEIVRWYRTPDGFESETIAGIYLNNVKGKLRLVLGSRIRTFPDTVWKVCIK